MSAHARASEGNFWGESKERRDLSPPLSGDLDVDVAVIGAGYTGLPRAIISVPDPSLDVAILEAETAGFGSERNAGFVMTLSSVADEVAARTERLRGPHA
jgi:glycine/D-amino acid oxidase-like deaminating enzyme